MSGTSGDGVDASVIRSDGISKFEVLKDKYFEYDQSIYKEIHSIKDRVFNLRDLEKLRNEISTLERKITLFHAKIVKELESNLKDLIIGFHGQTIYHNSSEKVSKQLADSRLLFQLTKKKIIFNFRKNDLINGGEGAPLTPLFHQLIVTNNKIKLPVCVLNIGGISNITLIKEPIGSFNFTSKDIGPGNCLIDNWVRKNSDRKFDQDGKLALAGEINQIIIEQAEELYANRSNKEKLSLDTNDFDISFARGLSLQDGATTLTNFTANIISGALNTSILNFDKNIKDILICGGGRKNKFLIEKIKEKLLPNLNLKFTDDFNINGDFVESQAFAFLAIRSIKNLPISFPNTTGCLFPCPGGEIIDR